MEIAVLFCSKNDGNGHYGMEPRCVPIHSNNTKCPLNNEAIWYDMIQYDTTMTTLTTLHETTSCVWWRQEPGQKSRSVSRSSAGHLGRLESDSPIPGWWCQLKNASQLGSYLHHVTIHTIIFKCIYIYCIIICDYIIWYMQYIPWVSHHMELYPHSGWFIPHSSTKTLGYSTMLWWYTILNILKYTPIGSCRILYILGTWTNLRYREAHPPGSWYARICDGKPQLWDEKIGKWQ